MELIITIADEDAKAFMDYIQPSYGWTGLAPDAVATRLCDAIKEDLVNRAVQGKNQIERMKLETEVKEVTARALTVTLKGF